MAGTFPRFTTATISGAGRNVPVSVNVDTGSDYIAAGAEKVGNALFGLGLEQKHIEASGRDAVERKKEIAQAKAERQLEMLAEKRRDNENRVLLSIAVAALDDWDNEQKTNIDRMRFNSAEELDDVGQAYAKSFPKVVEDFGKNLDEETKSYYIKYANERYVANKFAISNKIWQKKTTEVFPVQFENALTGYYRERNGLEEPPQIAIDAHKNWELKKEANAAKINALVNNVAQILDPATVEENQINAMLNVGMFKEAEDAIPKLKYVSSTEKDRLTAHVKTRREAALREANQSLKANQEANARQTLVGIWDGSIKDPNVITEAVRSGRISDTDGKELMKLILNPAPVATNNVSFAQAKDTVLAVGTGEMTKQEALSKIISLSGSISPADSRGLIEELYTEIKKDDAEQQRQALAYIDNSMLRRDVFGQLFGDTKQFENAATAKVILSENIKKIQREYKDKPIPAGEYLKAAQRIITMDRFKDQTLTGKIVQQSPAGLEKIWKTATDKEKEDILTLLTLLNPKTGKKYTPADIRKLNE